MKTELFIALRYLFAKKRHNTINMVTWVAVGGVVVGTMAMVCVMSVLNGFENVIESSLTSFDADIKISAIEGTWIERDDKLLTEVRHELGKSAIWCPVIEQDGMVGFEDQHVPVKVKGVGVNYGDITKIDGILCSGRADFSPGYRDERVGLLGIGLANKLGISRDGYSEISLYVPKNRRVNIARPDASFTRMNFVNGGEFFAGQEKYDNNYIIMPLDLVTEAYQFDGDKVNAYEIKITEGKNLSASEVEERLKERLGRRYKVQNRVEQQEDFYKMSQIEKWSTFLILSFIMLIATFNIVSSLSMIQIEKKGDVLLFRNLGADGKMVRRIFTLQGVMISFFGVISGMLLGVGIVALQENFGLLKMGDGFMVNAYPVELRWLDLAAIFIVVMIMGIAAARFTTRSLVSSIIWDEPQTKKRI